VAEAKKQIQIEIAHVSSGRNRRSLLRAPSDFASESVGMSMVVALTVNV
jgi:hypothetical protein